MNKKLFLYLFLLLLFGSLSWLTLSDISLFHTYNPQSILSKLSPNNSNTSGIHLNANELSLNIHRTLPTVIFQIILIMFVARFFGVAFRKFKQPSVIGEIIGGIVLGPSVLGFLFPNVFHFIFPASSLQFLEFFSSMGLILFMFIIGMELDIDILMKKALTAIAISHTTIVVTFFLGVVTASFLYVQFAPPNVSFTSFGLFMGISLSITAFPVLARIIQEKDLAHSQMGRLILTCAAIDDLTAWCILAVIIAIVKAGVVSTALTTIALAISFVLFMLLVVRPLLAYFGKRRMFNGDLINRAFVVTALIILFISAYFTEVIGIHTLFGSFMAGVVMPSDKHFKKVLTEKFEDAAVLLFLPLFFVYTGLRTQIGLILDFKLLLICGAIILVAIVGKVGTSTMMARVHGQNWKNSLQIGVLMNTRGLMELVVLNIAYDLGVFSPQLFTMMVVMALVTTCLTGPGLQMIESFFAKKKNFETIQEEHTDKVLLSFALSDMGVSLLQLSYWLLHEDNKSTSYAALHIKPHDQYHTHGNEINKINIFQNMHRMSNQLGIKVSTRFKVTEEIKKEIVATVIKGDFNFLLLGGSRPFYGNNPMSKTVRHALEHCECRVAIYTNTTISHTISNVVTILYNSKDKFLLKYADNIANNVDATLTVLRYNYDHPEEKFEYMQYIFKDNKMNDVLRHHELPDLSIYDIIVMSVDFWAIIDNQYSDLRFSRKLLIMKDYLE